MTLTNNEISSINYEDSNNYKDIFDSRHLDHVSPTLSFSRQAFLHSMILWARLAKDEHEQDPLLAIGPKPPQHFSEDFKGFWCDVA